MSTQFLTTTRKRKRPQDTYMYHGCGRMDAHFCFRGMWEVDEMFARPGASVLPQASSTPRVYGSKRRERCYGRTWRMSRETFYGLTSAKILR